MGGGKNSVCPPPPTFSLGATAPSAPPPLSGALAPHTFAYNYTGPVTITHVYFRRNAPSNLRSVGSTFR